MSPWGTNTNGGIATFAVVKDCIGADVPEGPIEGAYCLNIKVTTLGANDYAIGLGPRPQHDYEQGKKYTFSVFLKCKTGTLQVRLKPELATGAYTGYGSKVVTITDKWAEYFTTTPVFADKVTPGQISMHIGFAVAEFWVDDAKLYEGDYVPTPVKNQVAAASPTPDSKAVDVRRDPVLNWKAGPFAATHNVYLATSFDDVNAADVSQAVSRGQTGTTFQPAMLAGPNIERAGVRWQFSFTADPSMKSIMPRATDDKGNVQYPASQQKWNQGGYLFGAMVPHPITVS